MGTGAPAHIQRASLTMPTHEEVIAQNPLEAPAPFWDNVYYALNGFAAFFIASSVLGGFVCCCLRLIARVERWEESRCKGMDAFNSETTTSSCDGSRGSDEAKAHRR